MIMTALERRGCCPKHPPLFKFQCRSPPKRRCLEVSERASRPAATSNGKFWGASFTPCNLSCVSASVRTPHYFMTIDGVPVLQSILTLALLNSR